MLVDATAADALEKAKQEIRRQWQKLEDKDDLIRQLQNELNAAETKASSLRDAESRVLALQAQLQANDEKHRLQLLELKAEAKRSRRAVHARFTEQRKAFMALKASRAAVITRLQSLHARGLKLHEAYLNERRQRRELASELFKSSTVANESRLDMDANEGAQVIYPKKLVAFKSKTLTLHIMSTHSPPVMGDVMEATLLDVVGEKHYQWFRSTQKGFVAIEGANNEVYRATADDVGTTLKVECVFGDEQHRRMASTLSSTSIGMSEQQINEIRQRIRKNEAQFDVNVIEPDGASNKRRLLLNSEKAKLRTEKNTLMKAAYSDSFQVLYAADYRGPLEHVFKLNFGESVEQTLVSTKTVEELDHIIVMARVFKSLCLHAPRNLRTKQRVSLIQPNYLIFLVSRLHATLVAEEVSNVPLVVTSTTADVADVQYDSDGFCIRRDQSQGHPWDEASASENSDFDEMTSFQNAPSAKPMVILPVSQSHAVSADEIPVIEKKASVTFASRGKKHSKTENTTRLMLAKQ